MRSVKQALIEVVLVGAIGLIVGFTANGLRASDALDLNRNYFAKGHVSARPEAVDSDPTPVQGAQVVVEGQKPASEPDHPDHPYQTITYKEVVEVFNDPATAAGAAVFVDARSDAPFRAGHIPGALQADHYRLADYIEPVLEAARYAEKVIVYCNGGQCEDSIFMCKDLIDFEVPYDIIYLYEGGWAEWEAKGQPVETGDE